MAQTRYPKPRRPDGTYTFTLNMPEALRSALQEVADECEIPLSEVVRDACIWALEQREGQAPAQSNGAHLTRRTIKRRASAEK